MDTPASNRSGFTSVQSRRFHDEVALQIAQRIVAGAFAPGADLPAEAVLVEQFGVSRPVIREALRTLHQCGLVNMRQGKRTAVSARDEWDVLDPFVLTAYRERGIVQELVEDFLFVRRILEPEVAAEAARRVNPKLIRDLDEQIRAMEAKIRDPERFFEEDLGFHRRLADETDNRVLIRIMGTISRLFNMTRDFAGDSAKAQTGALKWHKKIRDQVELGDAEGARDAMQGHLDWTAKRITRSLSEKESLLK